VDATTKLASNIPPAVVAKPWILLHATWGRSQERPQDIACSRARFQRDSPGAAIVRRTGGPRVARSQTAGAVSTDGVRID